MCVPALSALVLLYYGIDLWYGLLINGWSRLAEVRLSSWLERRLLGPLAQ